MGQVKIAMAMSPQLTVGIGHPPLLADNFRVNRRCVRWVPCTDDTGYSA